MKKINIIVFAIIIAAISVNIARSDDFSDAMLKAKKNLNTAADSFEEKALVKVRGEFERILQLKKNQWIVYYYIGFIDYNLAFSYMSEKNQDNEKVKKYTQSGIENITKSVEIRDDFADSYVLLVALNFNRWVYEQDKMNDIISATQQAEDKAKKLDDKNPRFYLMKGISAYYTPEMFGGGAEAAITNLSKSQEIFLTRKEAEEYYPDWGKDQTYGYYALALLKRDKDGDKSKAKELIDKGIELCPNSVFLKDYAMKQYNEANKK